ncbi:MAG: protein kinase [Polyangiales bacterium]
MGPSSPRPSAAGSRLALIGGGRYELLHELASGGMATVYLARVKGAAGFERIVAIKCCHKHLREDEEFSAMFLDEARVVSELHHSNVVSTLDFGEDPEFSLFIVMEFVDGFSLQQVLRAAKHAGAKMPPAIALRVMIDMLHGLHAAHEHKDSSGAPLNIVHRDVSPQNVLVGIDGVTRIMDFGIARAEGRIAHTREGAIKGKLAYMPPEQHGLLSDKQHAVTARADVFAAAIVLWEAIAGDKLFQRESDAQTLRAAMKCDVPALVGRVDGATAALDVAIAKAIQRDPSHRYESAMAFIEALEASGVGVASTLEVSRWVRTLLNAHIEARHRLLRSFSDGPRADSTRSMKAVTLEATASVAAAPSSSANDRSQAVTIPAPPNTPLAREPDGSSRELSPELPADAPRFRSSVAPPKNMPAAKARSLAWGVGFILVSVAMSALAATVVVRSQHRSAPRLEATPDRVAPSALPAGASRARSAIVPPTPSELNVQEVRSAPAIEPAAQSEDAGLPGGLQRAPSKTLRARPSTPRRPAQYRPRFL